MARLFHACSISRRFALSVIILGAALVQHAEAQYRLQLIASGVGVQDSAGHKTFGHAFMIIQVPTRTGIKEDAFGFYPDKDGIGIIVGTPGTLNSEWQRNPDRLAHVAVTLDVPINDAQRKAVYDTMDKFNSQHPKFEILNSNCIDFVASVAKAVGLPTPLRSAEQLPSEYVELLKNKYDKKIADDQKHAEPEPAQPTPAPQPVDHPITAAILTSYCQRHGHPGGASNVNNTGYGWRCQPGNVPIASSRQVCQEAFGPEFRDVLLPPRPGKPNDWVCR